MVLIVSSNLARCIAKITGDGNLYYRYIRYSNTCKELLDEFEEDIKEEFGDINITKGVGNSGTSFLQIHGKNIINTFLKFLPSYKSNVVRIPEQIIKSSSYIKVQYIRALFDDEGSPNLRLFNKTKEWKRNLTLASNSVQLLKDVKLLLKEFNIKTSDIIRNNCNSDYDLTYYIGISEKINFIRFRDIIGFKHPSKIKRLNLIIESYGNTFSRNKKGYNKIKEKLDLICSQ